MSDEAKFLIFAVLILMTACEKNLTGPAGTVSFKVSEHFLSDVHVTAMDFDSEGMAWIGTFDQGVIRYNGKTKRYDAGNSDFLKDALIWDIAVDRRDQVWMGTNTGLICFDGTQFAQYTTANSPLPENVVWSIAVDQSNKLWLASSRFQKGGLVTFDGTDWQVYTPENSLLPVNSVRNVIVDYSNRIWFALGASINNAYIVRIDGDRWTIYDKQDFGFTPYMFRHLVVDPCNNLYGSLDYSFSSLWDITRPNIIKFNGYDWSIKNPLDSNNEPLGYVGRIAADRRGFIWAMIDGWCGSNLAVYNGKCWLYDQVDIPLSFTSELAFDDENDLWIGTGSGVYVIKQ